MAININNLSNASQVKQNVDLKSSAKKESLSPSVQAEASKMARQDSVSLTPQAQKFNELQKKAADAPAENQKKVAELKKAIMSGEYKINPEKLAESIANFEFDLHEAK